MEVDLIFKIAAIGIIVAVLNILLSRSGRDDQALMVTLAALVVVLALVVKQISELFEMIKTLFSLQKMELIIKAVVVGVVGVILALIVNRTNPEFSVIINLTVCAVLVTLAMKVFSSVTEVLEVIELESGFSSAYIAPVLKCVGIGIAARIGSDICKDSKQEAIASTVEICGAVCALYVSLPLIKSLMRMIGELS